MFAVGRAIWGLLAVLAVLGASAPAAQASLSDPSTAFASLPAFEAAVGGPDNGTAPGEQGNGFRHWSPAGIAVNGSEPGSTPIPGGHTAALARSRLQPWGIELGPEVAVANDGFKSVNSNAGFNPPDLWAPFNSNTTQLQIVAPAGMTSTPAPAVTRGLGVVFVNVKDAGTTIQYYSGEAPLLTQPLQVPTGNTSFAGVLFRDPVVTRVVITLGTATLFDFGGTGAVGTNPNTLAAGDDVVLAEPGAGQPTLVATAGVPISPALGSFDSNDSAGQIRATIDWGDATRGNGTIVPGTGQGFTVTGSHSYALPGSYTANVTMDDFSGFELVTQALVQVAPRATATGVTCSPSPVAVTASTTCTATVSDVTGGSPSSPSGMIFFSSTTPGGVFPQNAGCLLGPTGITGVSLCAVQFSPGQLPPFQARVSAGYGGDAAHAGSAGVASVGVHAQRCSLRALTRRLRPAGLGVLVSCDARSGVQISAKAVVSRNRRLKAFQLTFGSLRTSVVAGRPTVLVIKPVPGVLKALHAALRRGQHVSLKLTLTASSHATHRTTTTRVPAIRIRIG